MNQTMDAGFRPMQVYEQVAERIRAGILEGLFLPGSRMPAERELAAQFNVGRPAVREAIAALQNEQLVVTKRNSGTYICDDAVVLLQRKTNPGCPALEADLSPTSTLQARLLLEPAIVRRAAEHRRRDPLAETYLAQMETITNIEDPEQQMLWNNSDRLFHRQLAVMTGDPLLIRIADEVASTMDQPLWKRLKDQSIFEAQRIRLYAAEHRLIYEAIVEGDADAAAFYVEKHIKRVEKDITQEE